MFRYLGRTAYERAEMMGLLDSYPYGTNLSYDVSLYPECIKENAMNGGFLYIIWVIVAIIIIFILLKFLLGLI